MSNWFLLPHLSGLRISGPDAAAFAHAQFTSEIQPASPCNWRPTAWCNPKGRVLWVMLARADEAGVDLVVPSEQMDALPRKLQLYAIGRKLDFSRPLAVAGSRDCMDARDAIAMDPQRGLALDRADAVADGEAERWWRVCDIRSGLAWLSPEASGEFLPQALGLEERGGLSYRKGCYPGQEVIARVHYLGRAKEGLRGCRVSGESELADPAVHDQTGRKVGLVLHSERVVGQRIGLVVVSTEVADDSFLECSGRSLELHPPGALSGG